MNILMSRVLLLGIFSAFVVPWAHADYEVGNGTDNHRAQDNSAWFLYRSWESPRVIRYCYEIAPGFGADPARIEKALDVAFATWQGYVEKKGVNVIPARDYITAQAQLQTNCRGQEDVKFYFGVTSDEIRKETMRYLNPTAITVRTAYDPEEGWSKGYVWLAPPASVNARERFPNWSSQEILTGFLIHEVGHVMGCGHFSGTIMDADLSDLLQAGKYPLDRLSQIDYQHELLIGTGEETYSGEFIPEALADAKSPFGRKTRDHVKATLRVYKDEYRNIGTYHLSVQDALGTNLGIRLLGMKTVSPAAADVFKIDPARSAPVIHASIFTEYGYVMLESGLQVPVVIEFNGENPDPVRRRGPIRIRYFWQGSMYDLFASDPL